MTITVMTASEGRNMWSLRVPWGNLIKVKRKNKNVPFRRSLQWPCMDVLLE
jgi:hypothetical protein